MATQTNNTVINLAISFDGCTIASIVFQLGYHSKMSKSNAFAPESKCFESNAGISMVDGAIYTCDVCEDIAAMDPWNM